MVCQIPEDFLMKFLEAATIAGKENFCIFNEMRFQKFYDRKNNSYSSTDSITVSRKREAIFSQ